MVNRTDKPVERRFGRRETIGLIGASGGLLLVASKQAAACLTGFENFGRRHEEGGAGPACVLSPSQIEGPFFVDEKLNRSDIRVDPLTGRLSEGAPFRLRIGVQRVTTQSCSPCVGAQVDVWHCDSRGLYSDEIALGSAGTRFLRGYQMTDANGAVEFLTIFPGWYPGRAVHFHVKVRTFSGSHLASVFTTQLYLDDALTDAVHNKAPYNRGRRRDTMNSMDPFFTGPSEDGTVGADSGSRLLLATTSDGHGRYVGAISLGVKAV